MEEVRGKYLVIPKFVHKAMVKYDSTKQMGQDDFVSQLEDYNPAGLLFRLFF